LTVMGLCKFAKGWRKGAVKGNAEGQYELAHCYRTGSEGVKLDKVAAAAWYGMAADQEHAGAQGSLGFCYARGEGVGQNLELAAVTLYRKAAEAGHAFGQGLLASCYATGKGVEQNDSLAVAWWEKSATGGLANSQHRLGFCFMHGKRGLPKNARRARSYLKAAAAQGFVDAIKDLKLLNTCESCGAPTPTARAGAAGP